MKIKDFIKSLITIHMALVFGVMILMITMYTIKEGSALLVNTSEDVLVFIVPLIAFAGIAAAFLLPKKMILPLLEKETLREKLEGLRTVLLIKYAILEGPAILSIIAFYMTGNTLYLLIALVLVAVMYAERPTEDKISSTLQLSGLLKQQFEAEDGMME